MTSTSASRFRVGNRQEQLATLNLVGEALNRDPEFEQVVPEVLEHLVRLLGLSTGWIFLSNTSQGDSHHGSFSLAASTGLPPALARDENLPLCSGSCECQGSLRRGQLDRGVNMVTCSRLAQAEGDKGGLELHASVPLLGGNGPVGILNLAAPGGARFNRETLAFLAAVGKQLGVAFERSRLQAQRTREARYTAVLEERERVARQMHDSLAQLLFAADLSLQAALAENPPPAATAAVQRAAGAVRDALADLQGLVEVQRPADLSNGLLPALARLAQRTGSAAVAVHLDAGRLDVDGQAAEALYRIGQEAVGNALRHADAHNVWIRLRRGAGTLTLEIADDGKGFDPSAGHTGLGLSSMRSRALALGGGVTIDSDDGGTLVRAEVPWPGA